MKNKTALAFLVVLLAGGAFWYFRLPDRVVSEAARLEGGTVGVTVAVPGTVRKAFVSVGDPVTEGQPLFALDPAEYEAILARERASLAEMAAAIPAGVLVPSPVSGDSVSRDASLSELRREEEQARKNVEAASHALAVANIALSRRDAARGAEGGKEDAARQRVLIERDEAAILLMAAREAYEKASYARARKEALEKTLLGGGKPVPAILAARVAEYQAQISRVRLAEQNLADTVVAAPENGKIALMAALPGVRLAADDVPVSIVPQKTKDIWATAFFDPAAQQALQVNAECAVVFPGGKTVKGFIGAVRPPLDGETRFAAHVVLDQSAIVSLPAVGQEISVYVVTGKKFFIPGLRKAP